MSLTRLLVRHIAAKPIGDDDRDAASLYLLDALACAYAGSATATGRLLIDWAREEPLTTRGRAFLMAALTHITETDDLHRRSVTHPGCIVVPAVLAVGRRLGSDGQALLDATLAGFEAMCRIGNAAGPGHYRVFHNTATCGPYGSALAAARLLGLDESASVDALGNAGTQSAGLWQFLDTGAMSKHLHAARGSEAGVLAAELAQRGFTGAPAILEGNRGWFAGYCPDPQPDAVLAAADAPWELRQTSIKPWPSCRHTHPVIDAAIELHGRLGNRVVDRIHVASYRAALVICDRPTPDSEYAAKFSLQHCAARALQQGQIGLTDFDETARADARELAGRVQVTLGEAVESRYPDAWGAELVIDCSDGTRLAAQREHCKGDPELPLDRDAMIAKAGGLLRYGGLDGAAADRVTETVLSLGRQRGRRRRGPSTLLDDFLDHCLG